ncbi:MAG: hypothetical protein FJZ01_04100 [Candidatus Sericytochromatia bacterium]|nr:hypothetical protein [Candidatus Tanganyikabacteria bacterium]
MKKFAALVLVGALAGCGGAQIAPIAKAPAGSTVSAKSTPGLRAAWDQIHKQIFANVDANKDGKIDEYEAGTTIDLDTFKKADLNYDGAVDYNEFMKHATKGGFLQGSDTPDKFVGRLRDELAGSLKKLDTMPKRGWFDKGDGFLQAEELTGKALKGAGLGFYYPNLRISLTVSEVSEEQFKAADKTGDGKLGPAEFEDLYVALVLAALTPAGK